MRTEKVAGVLNVTLISVVILWCMAWLFAGAWYSHPNAEDLSLTSLPRDIGIIPSTLNVMTHYDGRYFTNILHGLNPLAWDWLWGYKLVPFFGIAFLAASLFFLIDTLFTANKGFIALFVGLFMTVHFATAPSLPHDLYWMVSSFVYLYPWGLTFIWLCSYIRYLHVQPDKNSLGWFLLTITSLFCCIGLNEMFLVTNFLLLVAIALLAFRSSDKLMLHKTIPVLIVGTACILFFISSPGISERAASERNPGDSLFNIAGIIQSIGDYKTTTIVLFKNGMILLSTLLIVVYFKPVRLRYAGIEQFLSAKTLWLLIAAFFVISYLMTLAYYIPIQIEPCYPSRIFNSSVVLQQLAFFILIPLLLFQYKLPAVFNRFKNNKHVLALACVALFVAGILFSENNIAAIKHDFDSGAVKKLDGIMHARYTAMNAAKQNSQCWQVARLDTVTLPNLTIYYGPDLSYSRNPEYWNFAYEAFFRLDEVKRDGDSTSKL